MATDAEESDTDERPTKRLRIGDKDRVQMDQQEIETEEIVAGNASREENYEEEENNEIETRARERLKKWQARQVAKGFVDNTINRVLENYVISLPFNEMYPRLNPRTDDMEDRAVAMAIQNHGLVQPTVNYVPSADPPARRNNPVNEYWVREDGVIEQGRCTCPLSSEQKNKADNLAGSAASADETCGSLKQDEENACWVGDKGDENNQQQDFLERAVAEAIKKKGLSALSVDYG
ncbi:uncharacterized protein LOC124404370 [Diprion similis]|uniref:uncharacterized protein LOC124404370 n=1 Tax=Diprion similis TaxID=362088 RepID=UPI001EF79770|nr:uncharacterized protein LOC124404370 [Diprion similis]